MLAFVLPFSSQAQNWTTIEDDDLGIPSTLFWGPSSGHKGFKINPYNDGIWWVRRYNIYNIDQSGNFYTHSNFYNQSDLNLPATSNVFYQEVDFVNEDVFVIDDYTDYVYKYDDNTAWEQSFGPTEAITLSQDNDSLWVCQVGEDMIKIVNDIPTYYPDAQRRIQSRNGHAWSTSGLLSTIQGFIRYYEPGTFQLYSADTSDFILDNYINDFKFMNNADTFYLAGNQGFSIAVGNQFIDTLSRYNTVNMPSGRILEFEFDNNDNVWALFGPHKDTVSTLAFLDRNTGEWEQIYTGGNSPVEFMDRVSLELDSQGNVYVITPTALHILELNTLPSWLNVMSQEQIHFEIFPNPSNGEFTIQIDEGIEVTGIEIVDFKGRVITKLPFNAQIDVELESGVYLVNLYNESSYVARERLIIID